MIAYRSQVSSNGMVDNIIIYRNTGKQYQYRDQYEYNKTVPIQEIDTNARKRYSFRKQYKYKFQTPHNRQGKNNTWIIKYASGHANKYIQAKLSKLEQS